MHNKTIAELSQGLAKGEYSSVELTQDFLQRIKRLDGQYNAFISVTDEQAMNAARHADSMRTAGDAKPFTGCIGRNGEGRLQRTALESLRG